MKTVRWHYLALAVILGGLVFLGAYALSVGPSPSRLISKENYDLIRSGMHETEVEAIFGGPAGDYSTQLPPGPTTFIQDLQTDLAGENYRLWVSDHGIILVFFDDAQRVDSSVYRSSLVRQQPTILEKLRAWIRM